jgi:hypothetical protein
MHDQASMQMVMAHEAKAGGRTGAALFLYTIVTLACLAAGSAGCLLVFPAKAPADKNSMLSAKLGMRVLMTVSLLP